MKSTCWDTRATDSIIKSGQKDTEARLLQVEELPALALSLLT